MSKRALAASAITFVFVILLLMPSTAGTTASPELQATAGVDYVDLNWNTVTGTDNYTVYRVSAGGLVPLVNVTSPLTSYHDVNVEEGENYVYCVTAWEGENESAPSNTVSITVLAKEKNDAILPILAIVLSIIAVQVCIVMLLYFSKQKLMLK
jgi:fibronectin type 3 domain-containing protein